MTLDADEFIRRFLLQVVPPGLMRIRHYGFLANRHREAKLALCRQLLDVPAPIVPATVVSAEGNFKKINGQKAVMGEAEG